MPALIKFIAMVRRKPGLSFEEFTALWCGEHPALVLGMPGVRNYVQNPAYEGARRQWPVDGIAEIWFDDKDAMKAAFASAEGVAANAHQDTFAGEVQWYLAEERHYAGAGE